MQRAFTVEALISRHSPKAKIWGNDVSLYSSVLGAYLAGQPFNLSVREEKFAWLTPYLADGETKAATVMVLFEAIKYEKDKNLFQHRHWSARCFRPGYPDPAVRGNRKLHADFHGKISHGPERGIRRHIDDESFPWA